MHGFCEQDNIFVYFAYGVLSPAQCSIVCPITFIYITMTRLKRSSPDVAIPLVQSILLIRKTYPKDPISKIDCTRGMATSGEERGPLSQEKFRKYTNPL